MPITKTEWEKHRSDMYEGLQTLHNSICNDYEGFVYTCKIMASIYDLQLTDFIEKMKFGDLLEFATYLTTNEYGDYNE